MNMVIITRHLALVEYLRELGLADEDTPVFSHATPEEVRGRHVLGVLPLQLAVLAERITVVPLEVPRDLRGTELTLAQIREFAGEPVTYRVSRVEVK